MLQLKVAAKINLHLHITGTRMDGYHTLDGFMQSVSIFDRLIVVPAQEIIITCPGVVQERNTAYLAAERFFAALGVTDGVHVQIEKGIPFGAGLGGSSADAAALLIALNTLYENPFSIDALQEIGLSIGADVPFMMQGGCMRTEGIGEQLTPAANHLKGVYLIVQPAGTIAAKDAYQLYDKIGGDTGDTLRFMEGLEKGDALLCRQHGQNSLLRACATLNPAIAPLLQQLKAMADYAFLTGSGSACVGYFDSVSAANVAYKALQPQVVFAKTATATPHSIFFQE